jgi:hypothetical protein
MKISQTLIAAAVIAALPLSAFAGDKDRTPASTASMNADFKALDTDGDKRISRSEASVDSKIVFASVDKNGDGYLDSTEFAHREMSNDSTMPSPGNSPSDPAQPRQ